MSQVGDRGDDGPVLVVGQEPGDEPALDLQLVDRDELQVVHRRVAGAEVVQRQVTPILFRCEITVLVAVESVSRMLSVISRDSRSGGTPASDSACSTVGTRSGWVSCRAERLTLTRNGEVAQPGGSASISRSAVRRIWVPSCTISPVSSARSMN